MKTTLSILFLFLALTMHAANPTFKNFDTNDFNVNGITSIGVNTNKFQVAGASVKATNLVGDITAGSFSIGDVSASKIVPGYNAAVLPYYVVVSDVLNQIQTPVLLNTFNTITTSSNRVLNILDFGADNTGATTNSSTIIKNAMAAAADSRRRVLQFPAGIYQINTNIVLDSDNTSIEALGLVILVQTKANCDTITITNSAGSAPNDNFIRGGQFLIDPGYYSGGTNSAVGIRVYGVNGGSIDGSFIQNVHVRHNAIGIKYQEVSNSKLFGCDGIELCGIGFEATNGCNGNFVNIPVTSCGIGMMVRGGSGWTIIGQDYGAPGMTNAMVWDGSSSGVLSGGNYEYYGGDVAPFKTIGQGGGVWTFSNVMLANFSSTAASYSFAFTDDGSNESTFAFLNGNLACTTNVGGVFEKIQILNNGRQHAYSFPSPVPTAIFSGGTLLDTNSWIGMDYLSHGAATVPAGQKYWDFSTIPPRWMLAIPTNTIGSLFQIDMLQYFLDYRAGLYLTTNGSHTLTGNNIFAGVTTNNNAWYNLGRIYNRVTTSIGDFLIDNINGDYRGILLYSSANSWYQVRLSSTSYSPSDFSISRSSSGSTTPNSGTALIPFFYIDLPNNRTTIGHSTASAAAGTATLTVEGTLQWTGVATGNGSGITNIAPPTFVQTNFISGKIYTNDTGRTLTANSIALITAGNVTGIAEMDLIVTNTASGYYVVLPARITTTLAGTLVPPYTTFLSVDVPATSTYWFTNLSSGAGNSSALVSGSGTLKTSP